MAEQTPLEVLIDELTTDYQALTAGVAVGVLRDDLETLFDEAIQKVANRAVKDDRRRICEGIDALDPGEEHFASGFGKMKPQICDVIYDRI